MLPFTLQVQHLHGKQRHGFRRRGIVEDHNAREEDKKQRLLSRVVIDTPKARHAIIKKKNLGTLSLNEVWSDTL